MIVHLVNFHGNRPLHNGHVWSEKVLPVHDVTLELAAASRPARVRLEPGGTEPQWSHAEGILRVSIPKVHIHRAVVVDASV